MNIEEHFLKYVSFDTQSQDDSPLTPSTLKQLDLAKYLVKELEEAKVDYVELVENTGVIYAYINENETGHDAIGLIAHMDTAPDCSGKDIKPRIIEKYDGKEINLLNGVTLSPTEFPSLLKKIGHRLITTDGTTLLGADDKAGIAIIMSTIEYVINHPDFKHGKICIAFTPDEEVGRGTENFDFSKFKCDYAYTLDGGDIEEIECETFNAAAAEVKIIGKSIHPGSAKGKMINAGNVAMEFDRLLPQNELPVLTEGYEGFHHLTDISGECEEATLHYIIRNHNKEILERQKQDFINAANKLNTKYGKELVFVSIKNQYENMKEYIQKDPRCLEKVEEAYRRLDRPFRYVAIRGGTDGANLSKMGLPTPNLGTGGDNYHGRYEYVSVTDMMKMTELLIQILK